MGSQKINMNRAQGGVHPRTHPKSSHLRGAHETFRVDVGAQFGRCSVIRWHVLLINGINLLTHSINQLIVFVARLLNLFFGYNALTGRLMALSVT